MDQCLLCVAPESPSPPPHPLHGALAATPTEKLISTHLPRFRRSKHLTCARFPHVTFRITHWSCLVERTERSRWCRGRQAIGLRRDALPPDGNNRQQGRNTSKKSYSAIVWKEYPQEATYEIKEISYFYLWRDTRIINQSIDLWFSPPTLIWPNRDLRLNYCVITRNLSLLYVLTVEEKWTITASFCIACWYLLRKNGGGGFRIDEVGWQSYVHTQTNEKKAQVINGSSCSRLLCCLWEFVGARTRAIPFKYWNKAGQSNPI